jgi:ATP-dependent DNA ligase
LTTGAPSRRNYGAMKDDKLLKVIDELQSGGDAYRRAVNGGGDPQADLKLALDLAVDRGLMQGSDTMLARAEAAPDDDDVRFIGSHLAAKGSLADIRDGWFMEPKLDGFWLQTFTATDTEIAWLRSGDRIDHRIPHINSWLAENLPSGTRLVGELMHSDGQGSRRVHGVLRRTTQDPYTAGCEALGFTVFDCLEVGSEDISGLPFSERRARLEAMPCLADDAAPVGLIHQVSATAEQYHRLVGTGFEGAILKDPAHAYQPGQRGKGVIKLKTHTTVDVVVMDVGEGNGELEGSTGYLVVGQHRNGELVRRGRVSSGLTRQERATIWANPQDFIGAVLELRHMGVDVDGFRHPCYVGWRPDLAPSQIEWHDGR